MPDRVVSVSSCYVRQTGKRAQCMTLQAWFMMEGARLGPIRIVLRIAAA